jgi:hypothetical protein
MLTLPVGRVSFSKGDSVVFGKGGLSTPQDPDSHLDKLLKSLVAACRYAARSIRALGGSTARQTW